MITICCRWQRFQARGNSQVEGRRDRGERERGRELKIWFVSIVFVVFSPSLPLALSRYLPLSLPLSLSPMICLSRPVCLALYFDLCVSDFVCQRVHPSLGLCFCFCLLPLLRGPAKEHQRRPVKAATPGNEHAGADKRRPARQRSAVSVWLCVV